jgi:hypothetical protein
VAKSLQLKTAIWLWAMVLWGSAAYAAETDLAKGLEAIPFAAIKYVLIFSFIGGVVGTLNKITNPNIVVQRVWLEVLKDLMSSLLAGMLAFFFTSWMPISFWIQAALITLAGVGGSKILDRMLEGGMFPWIDRLFGRINKDPAP